MPMENILFEKVSLELIYPAFHYRRRFGSLNLQLFSDLDRYVLIFNIQSTHDNYIMAFFFNT